MNKTSWGVLALVCTLVLAGCDTSGIAANEELDTAGKKGAVTTIQSGLLVGSDGVVLTTGYDQWGYNYQARMFNGTYCDAYRNAAWCQPYLEDNLLMKWNDAWLSNVDRDGDFKLDRHYGFPSYIGSGAWLTNHMSGEYDDGAGGVCKWNYFVKIVAAPANAVKTGGTWFTASGVEIGPVIWGEFAIIQEVSNDPCTGQHGQTYNAPAPTGFGFYN